MRSSLFLAVLSAFATCLLGASASYAQPLALQPGERLDYRVTWGPLGRAGDLSILATRAGDSAQPLTEVVVRTSSAGLVRMLYSFDGEARSLFDPEDGRLLSATATTRAKRKNTRATITLDHESASARYVDHLDASRNTEVALPEGRAMDLVTSLVEARAWDLRPGDVREVSILFDDEFYDLSLHALRYETVRTERGRREALLVTPRMDEKPRGIFKRGGEVRVWLDRAPPHLPLRFEVQTRAGTAVALLTDYRPPAAPLVAAPRATSHASYAISPPETVKQL